MRRAKKRTLFTRLVRRATLFKPRLPYCKSNPSTHVIVTDPRKEFATYIYITNAPSTDPRRSNIEYRYLRSKTNGFESSRMWLYGTEEDVYKRRV